MFHQWRSGALANGLPLLSCQVISASRLRALVGNWNWLTGDPENGSCRTYRKIDLFTWKIQVFLDCCQVSGPSSCDSSDGCRMNLAALVFTQQICDFISKVFPKASLHISWCDHPSASNICFVLIHDYMKNLASAVWDEYEPLAWSPQTLIQNTHRLEAQWSHGHQNHLKWWTILKDVNPLNFFVPLPSITWFLHHFCKFH